MPIFEYRCTDCGRQFEAFVTAERKAECPGCQGANLARLLSRPGMVGASAGAGRRESASLPMAGGCGAGTCGCKAN